MAQISYTELLSSLDEFEGTVLDDMSIAFAIAWFRSLANILAVMAGLPDINTDTTIPEVREYIIKTLQRANELPTKQDLVN